MRASTVPTSTVCPSWTRISETTPDAGDGTSVSTLSVEISSSVSSASIVSPTPFIHLVIVPSETETPICGMTTSTAVFVAISTQINSFNAFATPSACGMNAFSSTGENGTGLSGAVTRRTGASRSSNASSAIVAAISPPKPPVRVSSCSTSTFDVFRTESSTACLSHGRIVRRSMISIDASTSFAASSAV